MKKNRPAAALQEPQPEKCAICVTPTRCRASLLGNKGPRCVGRSDGPDTCDCINSCGDDPWLQDGRSKPCTPLALTLRGEAMDRHSGGTTWIFSVPPFYASRVKLVHVVAGFMPEPRRESGLHNGFHVWLERWDFDSSCWRLVIGSISSGFRTREEAHAHASLLWETERLK